MIMKDIKEMAKRLGLNPGKMKKVDLIRSIQAKEGNIPCFQTEVTSCDQPTCCWKNDCIMK